MLQQLPETSFGDGPVNERLFFVVTQSLNLVVIESYTPGLPQGRDPVRKKKCRCRINIKLSLADEKALQFAAEDNSKIMWDKIGGTFICRGEDRKIDAGNQLKNIIMNTGESAADYIARARGISRENKKSPSTSQRNITQRSNSSRNGHVFTAPHREEKLCGNIWILDNSASCYKSKESVWFKNISPEVMDIYLADKTLQCESNGKAERANHVLLKRARSLLYENHVIASDKKNATPGT
ncbi:retrovirus-related Pol polyprotein from transposon TNT 1-94 [Trichonephila clavipes]|nr:retrovirus-related Pol polyprotein from transposon TNT 1-94 [Trichonephila clavipes]